MLLQLRAEFSNVANVRNISAPNTPQVNYGRESIRSDKPGNRKTYLNLVTHRVSHAAATG